MSPVRPAHTALAVELARPGGGWVRAGTLRRRGEVNSFETLPSYWQEDDRPILGQLFEERGPEWRPVARVRLPEWFSHLLPEGLLRDAIASEAQVSDEREFFLLDCIGGDDLPGALRTRPVDEDGEVIEVGAEPDDGADEPPPTAVKFSLAGLQLKFSIRSGSKGLALPASGEAGNSIAKLPDTRAGFGGVPEAELAALRLAEAAGIEVPEARLVNVAEIHGLPPWATISGRALLVRRFDRTDGGRRVHFEEFAQILDISATRHRARYDSANFETVARLTATLCGPESVGAVIDRIVLNVLIGNGDAHLKNWAVCYPDGHSATLSPAYDILPTILYIPNDDLGLNLAGSKAFSDVSLHGFERLADRAGWDGTLGRERAISAVERVVDAWPLLAEHLPSAAVDRLTAHRDRLRLVRRH